MRDLQHWKDKVELTLDGRQVFFLFFGGAVLACLLFAVGVMTGRRLEARAIAIDTTSAEDPLAALDQLGAIDDEELSYHRALTHDRDGRSAKPVAVAAQPVQKPVAAPSAAKPIAAAAQPAPKPAPIAAAPKPAPIAAAPKPAPPAARPAPRPARADVDAPVAAEGPHFTLQLSAFSVKKDADDFVQRAAAVGYHAFVVSSDQPGRGTLYRVRVGDYASKDAALAEKGSVDKKLKVSAYLAKM